MQQRITKDCDEMKERIKALESDLASSSNENEEENQQLRDLSERYSALELDYDKLRNSLSVQDASQNRIKELEETLAHFSIEFDEERETIKEELNLKIAALSRSLDDATSTIESKDVELCNVHSELDLLNESLDELKTKLNTSHEETHRQEIDLNIPDVESVDLLADEPVIVEEMFVPVSETVELMAGNEDFMKDLDEQIDGPSDELLTNLEQQSMLNNVEKVENLRSVLSEKEGIISSLQDKILQLENDCIEIGESSVNQLSILNKDVEELTRKVIEQEDLLSTTKEENVDLLKSIDSKDASIVNLESQVEILKAEHMTGENVDNSKLVASLQSDLAYRKKVIARMDQEIDNLKSEIENSAIKSQEIAEVHTELEQKNGILNEKLRLKTENYCQKEKDFLEEFESLRNELITLQNNSKSNEVFHSETTKYEQKLVVLQERLKMKTQALEEVQQTYNSATKSWEDEKEMLEANCAACHQEFVDLKTEHVNSQSQWLDKEASLNSQIGELTCENSLLNKETDDLRQTIRDEQDAFENKYNSLENRFKELEEHDANLQKTIADHENKLHEEENSKDDLLLQLNAIKEAFSRTEHENSDLEQTRVDLQNALGDLALRKKLVVSMETEIQGLKQKLLDKEDDLASKMIEPEAPPVITNGVNIAEEKFRKEIEHLTASLIRAETKASNAIMEAKIKEDTMKLREDNYKQQAFCLQTELQDQNAQIGHLQTELQNAQFSLMCSEKEKETLLKKNQEKMEAIDQDLRQAREELVIKSNTVHELKENEVLKKDLAQKKTKIITKKLEDVLPEHINAPELKQLVDGLVQQIANQEIDIKARKKMVSINDQLLNESKEETKDLKQEIEVMQEKLSEINAELESTRIELSDALERNLQHDNSLLPHISEHEEVVQLTIPQLMSPPPQQPTPLVNENYTHDQENYMAAPYDMSSSYGTEQYGGEKVEEQEECDGEDDESIQDEFQKYIDMVEELQLKQQESEEKQTRLEKDKAALQQQLQHLLREKEDLEQQIFESESKIREYERLVMKFAEETDEAKGVVGSITYQRDVLHNDLYQLQQTYTWREKELADQLVHKQNEINGLHENMNGLQENITALHSEREQQLNAKDMHISSLANEHEITKKDLLANQHTIEELQQVLHTKGETLNNLQVDLVRLTQTTADQNQTNEELTTQIRVMSGELARVKEEFDQHRVMYSQNIQALQQCFVEVSDNSTEIEQQLQEAQQQLQG